MKERLGGISFFGVERPDPEILALLPADSAEKLAAVPIRLNEAGRLIVAMCDPEDLASVEEIRMLTGRSVIVQAAHEADIRRAISDFYKVAVSVREAMQEHKDMDRAFFLDMPEDMEHISPDDAPVVKLLNHIFALAASENASDIHIEPHAGETKVRIRVDGLLSESLTIPMQLHAALLARVKIMARMDIAEKRRPQDGRIMRTKEGRKIDIRVSSIPSVHGEKAVLRMLDHGSTALDLETLGFSKEQKMRIETLIRAGRGICLITGPTGSGKSTTLCALLQRLRKGQVNVVTIEDPVEYNIEGITQIQVNEKIGLSFGTLLRSVLRQDPDIIMVGEIRDSETAQLAVRAALTGHLVLATLHTNDAPSAVSRLLDMGVPHFLLASSLIGVISQRLVRQLCPHCKKKTSEAHPFLSHMSSETYAASGCERCRGTGYAGRTVVSEIMQTDEGLRELVSATVPAHKIRAYARQKGMQDLFENALEKVAAGTTDMREVYLLGAVEE